MQSCLPRCTGCIRETVRVRLTCGTYGQMQAELGRKSRVLSEEEQELGLSRCSGRVCKPAAQAQASEFGV